MRYHISKSNHQPSYMQLYLQLREDITGGAYQYGMRLPSKRILAEEAGVSVITAGHAYDLLIDEGYARAQERSGYFACYRAGELMPVAEPGEHTQAETSASVEIRGRAEGEGDPEEAFPFSVFARTMRRVLTQYQEKVMESSPPGGVAELRHALASYLARGRGINVSPEQILVGSGAEDLYGLLVPMLGRDRLYAIEDPSYEKIRNIYEANGANVDPLKMGPDGIMDNELIRTEATVLHVTPFNSYPSRVTATASKRAQYIQWALGRNAMIIEDDYDSEFSELTKAEETLYSLEPDKTVIYINTFSKTIASSMRIGYMVLPGRITKELKNKISFYSCSVPVFEQYVLAQLIENGDFERHINRVRRIRRRQKEA